MIRRFSSRLQKLDASFINERLKGAVTYDRIAGYFRSSMLEVAGEKLEEIGGNVRVVCNSDIDSEDSKTAKAAQQALRRSWCEGNQSRIIDPSLFEENDDQQIISTGKSDMKKLTEGERSQLERCLKALESNQERDPKYQKVVEYIVARNWLEFGCIVFSQYFDSIWWLAKPAFR